MLSPKMQRGVRVNENQLIMLSDKAQHDNSMVRMSSVLLTLFLDCNLTFSPKCLSVYEKKRWRERWKGNWRIRKFPKGWEFISTFFFGRDFFLKRILCSLVSFPRKISLIHLRFQYKFSVGCRDIILYKNKARLE